MTTKLSNELQRKLITFGHRRLLRGEAFLLAKTIADKLPVGTAMADNIRTYTLNQRELIDGIIYGLADFIYIPHEDAARIYTLIDSLLMWRMSVAFAPASLIYSGDPNNVVDETTGILRYVDVADICSVADIAQNATYTAALFREFADCR